MIDTHAHLNFSELATQLNDVLMRAKLDGVTAYIVPATDLETSRSSLELARLHPSIHGCIGMHPSSADEYTTDTKELFIELLRGKLLITSIGEVGLDYYHFDTQSTPLEIEAIKQKQQEVFMDMIGFASEYKLPLIIHSREAFADTKRLLAYSQVPAVIHCFTGTHEQAEDWLEQGCLISLTGIITYKKNSVLRETVRQIPLDKIMIETDSPYLAPEGSRGEVNEPRFVRRVAQCIAEIKDISIEDVDMVTTATAHTFFKI